MSSRVFLILGIVFSLFVAGIAFAPSARAADFRGGDRIVIAADQVVNDDLYVSASEIIIDGTVNGDMYALGSSITINGTVKYDVIAGAQTVTINGNVGSDLRAGAQAILLGDNAKIARSALLGGYSIETKPNSSVGGDFIFGAYQALLAGAVTKDVIAGANGIELRGSVGRNVRVSLGDGGEMNVPPTAFMPNATVQIPAVPSGLTIAPTAKIGGDLVYESKQPARVNTGSQVTGPVVQQTPVPSARQRAEPATPAEIQARQTQQLIENGLNHLRRFVILLLLGLLALWLLPKWIQALAETMRAKPLGSLGRGVLLFFGFILALIAITLGMILLAILFGVLTLGDLAGLSITTGIVALGILGFAYSVFTAYVAPVVVSYLIGRLILELVGGAWSQNRFIAFGIGLILLTLVSLVPIVDVIVGIVVALIALGALALWLMPRWKRSSPAAVPVPVP